MTPPCSEPVELARKGQLRVRSCSCGSMHLDLGPFTVRMERAAMGELRDLLDTGLHRLALAEHHDREPDGAPDHPHLRLVEPEAPAAR